MPTITVKQPFRLNLEDGTFRDFKPGTYDIDEETAAHWYVQANSHLHTEDADLSELPEGDDIDPDKGDDDEGDDGSKPKTNPPARKSSGKPKKTAAS